LKPLILVGGGGHCKAVLDVLELEGTFTIRGILDTKERIGETVLGYPVIGTDEEIISLAKEGMWFLITVGQVGKADTRIRLFESIRAHTDRFATVVSPLAYVSGSATVGRGTVVMHHALVNADAIVGCNCIINTKALVEHDATVEKHCHIATGAIINGGSRVREGSFVGSGAVMREYVETRPFDFIKACSLFKGYGHG
jgi:sugar O-acyltransferase (sialic acid O-acetyltransferase NeuD family)